MPEKIKNWAIAILLILFLLSFLGNMGLVEDVKKLKSKINSLNQTKEQLLKENKKLQQIKEQLLKEKEKSEVTVTTREVRGFFR